MNQCKVYYQNRASFGMWNVVEATSIKDAITKFKQLNKGCEVTSVIKL